MDRPPSPERRAIRLVILLILVFAAGYLIGRGYWLPGIDRPPPGVERTFRPFWEAWNLVDAHYVDRQAVRPERMTQGAIEGMLLSLGDVGHTTYLTADDVKHFEQRLSGDLEGIGVQLTIHGKKPTIVRTLPGSPARAAGLRAGDVLLDVEGKDVSGRSLEQIADLVRGPSGSTVHLRVLRGGAGQPLEFTVTRARVEVADVSWRLVGGDDLAHVYIRQFGNHVEDQLQEALAQARQAGVRGLVIDLRGDPGGEKDKLDPVAGHFLPAGSVIFLQQDARGNRTEVKVSKGTMPTDLPVCLLIDEGTASAAEILAGAIQDHKRGRLVGTTTFGTGTVLRPFPLSDGSAVLLAVAEWLTPDGRQIWHQGIKPDIEVTLPRDVLPVQPEQDNKPAEPEGPGDDVQLKKAIEVLRGELR
jgi:carboxyl-terminal processing protease